MAFSVSEIKTNSTLLILPVNFLFSMQGLGGSPGEHYSEPLYSGGELTSDDYSDIKNLSMHIMFTHSNLSTTLLVRDSISICDGYFFWYT